MNERDTTNADDPPSPTRHASARSNGFSSANKQSVRVTRSDPLSSTSDKSHLIRSKHSHHHHLPNHASSQKPNISNSSNHHSRERRARWIRDRMSCHYNNQHHNNTSQTGDSGYHSRHNCHCCSQDPYRSCTSQSNNHSHHNCSGGNGVDTFDEDFGWTQFSTSRTSPKDSYNRQNSSANWISENDSKASRFHRPYSVKEQRSWLQNNQNQTDRHPYPSNKHNQRHQRLRAGLSLPSQSSFAAGGNQTTVDIELDEPTTPKRESGIREQVSFLGEHEPEEDEEEDQEDYVEGGHSYLRRKYCLKGGHRRKESGGGHQNLGEPIQIVRRSRSGSPCSITSESTESVGDCENALDPPHLTLPNGDIQGAGQAVPVSCGMPNQYSIGGGSGGSGRKFSVLFSANDSWSEENIVQSLRELSPTATTIFEAAWMGNGEALDELLDEEENLTKLRDGGPSGFRDMEGRTPLHLASACGHVDCVKLLLEKGAPVNAMDNGENKATPLSCAASCGALGLVKVLLEGGADVNAGYEQGKTALHWAIQAGSVECAKVLLEAGAKQNPPQVYSETPLHVSASQGDPECLQLLLDYGADVNLCKGSNRSTALHLSSEEGSAACVRLLLKAGASHAAKDIRGHTALHVAATCDADCVIALLKAGADPNAVDANGRTPLHCAVARGSRAAECVRLLVESGADIDAQDNYGYTPLHLSAVNESSQCASILLHHGSDVTLKTNAGTNALSLLVRRIPDVMRYLVDRLDSAVTIHDHDAADPDCEVRLDFRAIVPNCEKRHGNHHQAGNGKNNGNGHVGGGSGGGSDRQKKDYFSKPHKETEFLTCLVAAGNKKILAHPLSEAFLTLKWRRVRKFFWASLLFQIALVALFTIYVVEVYLIRCPYRRPEGYNHSEEEDDDGYIKVGGGIAPGGDTLVIIPSKPPLPVQPGPDKRLPENNGSTTSSHNITRRSADPDFSWFSVVPPHKRNRTRTSKKSRNDVNFQGPPVPPSAVPHPVPPTQRNRGRGVHIIIPPPPTPSQSSGILYGPTAAPATGGPPPSSKEDSHKSSDRSPRMDPIHCRLSSSLQVIWILLVSFASLMAIKEIFQLIQSPISYVFSSENWGQWLLISSVTMTAWSTPEFQLEYWQYPAAACGIFLAWGLMLLQVGRFPALGLYVQMLGKVAANFGLFILAYACLLIAFALAFCVLFPEHPPYSSVALSILKVFTMMVGEVEYEDLFYKDRPADPILFPITAHLLYGAFVVIVTIVLMNLLVGLAVHDIQGLQKGAKLNRLSRQTALISRLESFIFSKKLQSVLPRSLGSILQKSALLVPSSYNWSFYFRPNDPRDKRLPKDIKQASLRLAASRHSSTRAKSPHHLNHSHAPASNHRHTHVTASNTPMPVVSRPLSSVSHHTSTLLPQHPELALRRMEQRLDHLQSHLEKALGRLNGQMEAVLGALKIMPEDKSKRSMSSSSKLSSSKRPQRLSVSQKSQQSDYENDTVFFEEGMVLAKSTSVSPSSSVVVRERPDFTPAPSILKDVSCEKG